MYRRNLRLGVHFFGDSARVDGRLQNKKEEGPPDRRRLVPPRTSKLWLLLEKMLVLKDVDFIIDRSMPIFHYFKGFWCKTAKRYPTLKTIPCSATHTRLGQIRECLPPHPRRRPSQYGVYGPGAHNIGS